MIEFFKSLFGAGGGAAVGSAPVVDTAAAQAAGATVGGTSSALPGAVGGNALGVTGAAPVGQGSVDVSDAAGKSSQGGMLGQFGQTLFNPSDPNFLNAWRGISSIGGALSQPGSIGDRLNQANQTGFGSRGAQQLLGGGSLQGLPQQASALSVPLPQPTPTAIANSFTNPNVLYDPLRKGY